MALRHVGLALALLLLAAGLTAGGIVKIERGGEASDPSHVFIDAVIAGALGALFTANAMRMALSKRRALRTLDRMARDEQWRDQDPLPRISLGPAAQEPRRASRRAEVLTLAAAPLFWVPVIGLLLAGPAWLGLRRTNSRLRRLSCALGILAMVATGSTLGGVVLVIWQFRGNLTCIR